MFLKCGSVWLKRYIAIFFYHMILMPFLHIRIKLKVGLDKISPYLLLLIRPQLFGVLTKSNILL